MRFYFGCIAFMIVPFLSSCASGNGVSVLDMGGWKAEYSLSAFDSLPGIAGNPADIMVLDSLLLVRDGEQLVICNTDSRESRTLFGRGRGPGEMLGFYDFSYDAASRELAMLDVSSQSILSACIDSLLSDDYLSGSIRRSQLLDVPMLFGICFAGDSLLGVGMFQDCRVASLAGDAGLGYEPYARYAPNAGDKESYPDNILKLRLCAARRECFPCSVSWMPEGSKSLRMTGMKERALSTSARAGTGSMPCFRAGRLRT